MASPTSALLSFPRPRGRGNDSTGPCRPRRHPFAICAFIKTLSPHSSGGFCSLFGCFRCSSQKVAHPVDSRRALPRIVMTQVCGRSIATNWSEIEHTKLVQKKIFSNCGSDGKTLGDMKRPPVSEKLKPRVAGSVSSRSSNFETNPHQGFPSSPSSHPVRPHSAITQYWNLLNLKKLGRARPPQKTAEIITMSPPASHPRAQKSSSNVNPGDADPSSAGKILAMARK